MGYRSGTASDPVFRSVASGTNEYTEPMWSDGYWTLHTFAAGDLAADDVVRVDLHWRFICGDIVSVLEDIGGLGSGPYLFDYYGSGSATPGRGHSSLLICRDPANAAATQVTTMSRSYSDARPYQESRSVAFDITGAWPVSLFWELLPYGGGEGLWTRHTVSVLRGAA